VFIKHNLSTPVSGWTWMDLGCSHLCVATMVNTVVFFDFVISAENHLLVKQLRRAQ
jgi:hypothetical protein